MADCPASSLFARFAERCGLTAAELDELLDRLHARSRQACAGVALDRDLFVRRLAARCEGDGALEAELAALHVEDLYLACACLERVPGAIELFETRHLSAAAALTRTIDAADAFVDEVQQLVREKLFIGSADAPPRIGTYSGRGPLAAWVAVVVRHAALSLRRSAKPFAQRAGEPSLVDALPAHGDPELDYLQVRYRSVFRDAFARALAALTERQRLLLRLNVIDGMSHEEIASVYKVSQSTVTRWIAATRRSILQTMQQQLRAQLDAGTTDFHSLFAVLHSQLDLSIARLLAPNDL